MTYEVTIKNIEEADSNKIVGFYIETEDNQRLAIDKSIPIDASKTTQQYISEALALAKPQIDEWLAGMEFLGVKVDPATGEVLGQEAQA